MKILPIVQGIENCFIFRKFSSFFHKYIFTLTLFVFQIIVVKSRLVYPSQDSFFQKDSTVLKGGQDLDQIWYYNLFRKMF